MFANDLEYRVTIKKIENGTKNQSRFPRKATNVDDGDVTMQMKTLDDVRARRRMLFFSTRLTEEKCLILQRLTAKE